MYTKNFKKYCNSDENRNDRKSEQVPICPIHVLDNATHNFDKVHNSQKFIR